MAATTSSAFSAPSIFKRGKGPAVASMSSSVNTFLAFAFCTLALRAAAASGLLFASPGSSEVEVDAAGAPAGGEDFWAKLRPEVARSMAPDSAQPRVEKPVRMSALGYRVVRRRKR